MNAFRLRRAVWSVALFVAVMSLIAAPAIAAEVEAAPAPAAEEHAAASPWRFDMVSWVWLLGMTGDVGVGRIKAHVDADFGDVLEASDSLLAFSGRLELGYGPVAGFVDGTWAKLGVEDASGPRGRAKVDITNELGVVDFGLMYRVDHGALLGDRQPAGRESTIDVYVGARYLTIGLDVDPARLPGRSDDRDGFDPIVGVKVRQPITERFHVDVWGDVGGFGIESDVTWSATAALGYNFDCFGHPATLYGGYRAIAWDFEEGSGRGKFVWDMILHGPTLGFEIDL